MTDKVNKGRSHHPTGEKNASAELTKDEVIAIKAELSSGATNVSLGIKYGVTHSAISKIKTGRTWGHVDG
jgi:hypothetical protein